MQLQLLGDFFLVFRFETDINNRVPLQYKHLFRNFYALERSNNKSGIEIVSPRVRITNGKKYHSVK